MSLDVATIARSALVDAIRRGLVTPATQNAAAIVQARIRAYLAGQIRFPLFTPDQALAALSADPVTRAWVVHTGGVGELGNFFSDLWHTVLHDTIEPFVNPLETIRDTIAVLPAAATGFATGGPYGAIAAAAIAHLQQRIGQIRQGEHIKSAQADVARARENIIGQLAAGLVKRAGVPPDSPQASALAKQYADQLGHAQDQQQLNQIVQQIVIQQDQGTAYQQGATTINAVTTPPASSSTSPTTWLWIAGGVAAWWWLSHRRRASA